MQGVTSAPKALLPLAGETVLARILREALAAGLTEIGLVVSPADREVFEAYLASLSLPAPVTFIEQPAPAGLGDAVAQAKTFVDRQPFVVLLGDHVRPGGAMALARLMSLAETFRAAWCAGTQVIDASQAGSVGVASGLPLADHPGVYRCGQLVEKPDITALAQLKTPSLQADTYLAHNGQYVFAPTVFDALRQVASALPIGGELGLTEAQQTMLAAAPERCYLLRVDTPVWDTGSPAGYAVALAEGGESDCQG